MWQQSMDIPQFQAVLELLVALVVAVIFFSSLFLLVKEGLVGAGIQQPLAVLVAMAGLAVVAVAVVEAYQAIP
jgi:hypothetical protein